MLSNVESTDLPEVRALITAALRECVLTNTADLSFVLSEVDQTLKYWLKYPKHCIHRKFTRDGTILGIVLVKHFWNLSCLFVAPEHQRKGIGSTLLKDALIDCRDHAPQRCVKLNSSTVAVPFYRSLGFRPCGRQLDLPGGCIPLVFEF